MKIERTKNAIRNMTWGYLYRFICILLPFILRTVIIRKLGAEYLGINGLFTSILQVLNLSELGFGSAIVYDMYKPVAEEDKEKICSLMNYYRRVYVAVGGFIMAAGLLIMPFLSVLISGDYPNDINLYFVYFMFLLNTAISYFLFAYRSSLLSAFQRNDIETKILITVTLFRYVAEIICISITNNYYLFLYLEVFSTILVNVLRLYFTRQLFPEYHCKGSITLSQRQNIRENVSALLFHKIGAVVLNSGDNIVISAFLGIVMVSNYGNYYYVLSAVQSLIVISFAGMTAGIGNSFVVESVEHNRQSFKRVLFLNAWLVSAASTLLLCLYQDFMMLWVGGEYMFNDIVVVLMVIYFFVYSIRRTIIVYRDGAGMWKNNKWQPIISGFINIFINIALVNIIGIYGIVVSSIICMVFIDIPWEAKSFCGKIKMERREYIIQLLEYFAVTVIVAIVIRSIVSLLNFPPIPNFIIKAIICILITNVFLCVIYHSKSEFAYFLELIKRYVRRVLLYNKGLSNH